MSDIAIQVEKLGKLYQISETTNGKFRYKSLRDVLAHPFRRRAFPHYETIWALKDVSFEIKQGEVVGIIGRNGAGKSTLLKILSRITQPTEGRIEIFGHVGSLLEVGAGFHPELTGRENIFLNGAILGMKRIEIQSKFDEIVAFAEVEKFLDTPVKHYSSGMYVRLAFAVAAHLQPEILLVDEVLAVGDIEFQKKCVGKMEKVANEGRTVILVSHNMSTVKALCSRAMLLDGGAIRAIGQVDAIVATYLSDHKADPAVKFFSEDEHINGVRQVRVKCIRLVNAVHDRFCVYWLHPITLRAEVEVLEHIERVSFGAGIRAMDGTKIFTAHHDDGGGPNWAFDPGFYQLEFTLDNQLAPGLYKLHFGADREHLRLMNLFAVDAITLEVLDHTEQGKTPLATNEGLLVGHSVWDSPRRLD